MGNKEQASYDSAREVLGLARLSVTPADLRAAIVVGLTGNLPDGSTRGLTLDEAAAACSFV